ncbi:MAG: hypothetical protein U0263_08115 [Polyangiaceae bacterium]
MAEQLCQAGKCVDSCPSGQSACNGSCESLGTDPSNCGSCGNVCTAPTGGSVSCSAGKCTPSCPAGKTHCNGSCVDLLKDHANCGSCGYTCGGNFACSAGKCSTSSCAFAACTVDNTYDSGTHLECCDSNETCKYFWLNDINGNPKKHYYCSP